MSFDPRTGALWRSALEARQSTAASAPRVRTAAFNGADNSRLTANWSSSPMHLNRALFADLRTLRARSRELARNNDYARKFLALVKNNVCGHTGFGLQVQALTASGSIDERGSMRCENAFKDWSKAGNCEVTGRLSFTDACRLFIETVARDGEVLVRHYPRGSHGYQFELVDPSLLDERLNMDLPGGGRVRMGVEYNSWHQPVAYWLARTDTADPMHWGWFGGSDYERVPADQMTHHFVVEMIGQLRGMPWMATAMYGMNMLAGFDESALVAARTGAAQSGFFTSPDADSKWLTDAYEGGSGSGTGAGSGSEVPVMEVEPGVFRTAPPGTEFHKFDPDYPHAMYAPFVKAVIRRLATGLLSPYHDLANDLEGVNFSSIRSGVLEAREVWKALQEWMIGVFLAPTYSRWLPQSIVSGQLNLPFDKLAKFDAAVWQGRRWDWVDPLKDVNAQILAVQNGFKSYSQVIREQGGDPQEIWRELETDRARLQGMGLNLTGTAQAAPPASGDDDDEPEPGNAGKQDAA